MSTVTPPPSGHAVRVHAHSSAKDSSSGDSSKKEGEAAARTPSGLLSRQVNEADNGGTTPPGKEFRAVRQALASGAPPSPPPGPSDRYRRITPMNAGGAAPTTDVVIAGDPAAAAAHAPPTANALGAGAPAATAATPLGSHAHLAGIGVGAGAAVTPRIAPGPRRIEIRGHGAAAARRPPPPQPCCSKKARNITIVVTAICAIAAVILITGWKKGGWFE
jgi:hypothetical protein